MCDVNLFPDQFISDSLGINNVFLFKNLFLTKKLPIDILKLIIHPFQENEQSLFVSLVCKTWYSIIKRKKISVKKFVLFYAPYELSTLQLVRQSINQDRIFFKHVFAQSNHPDVIEWAFHEIQGVSRTIFRAAASGLAKGGHLELLQSLHRRQLLLPVYNLCCPASSGGHLDILQWLKSIKFLPNDVSKINFSAAKYNHKHILQWLHDNKALRTQSLDGAAEAGHLKLLDWLTERARFSDSMYRSAAKAGHVHILKWLNDKYRVDYGTQITEGAAEGGHFDILQNETMWSINVCSFAAQGGQLEMLKYLKTKGFNCTMHTCVKAAESGNLETMKWLREIGCPWGYKTTDTAASCGHLEVLKYALDNGCRYSESCAISAVKNERWNILRYLKIKGYDLSNVCDTAAEYGHLDILKWIEKPKGTKLYAYAAANGDLEMLKYLYESGIDWKMEGDDPIRKAVARERVHVLKWMRDIGMNIVACVKELKALDANSEVWKWVEVEYPKVYKEANCK